MSKLTKVAVKKINVNNNKRRASSFIMTDTYIFNALKTKHKALAVYMQLKSMLNNVDGTCCPSLDTMAKELGMNKSTVSRAVKELQELGFIDWAEVKEGRYPTRYYLFKYPQDMNGKCVDESTEEEVVTEEDKAIIAQHTVAVSELKQEKQSNKGPKPKLVKKTKAKETPQEKNMEELIKDLKKEVGSFKDGDTKDRVAMNIANLEKHYALYVQTKGDMFYSMMCCELDIINKFFQAKKIRADIIEQMNLAIKKEVA